MAVTDGSNTPHASRDQLSQGRPNYSPSSYNNLFFNFVDRISSGMEGSSRDSSDNEKDIDVQKKPLETADVGSYNSKKKTQQMTSCMDDLSLRSPQKRGRASRSRSVSKRKTRSPSSSGSSCRSRSCSSRSASSHSRYSSCSTLHSRSRSRSRGYRGRRRRYRSRSYSRSRSRSPSRSYSRRYRSRGHRSRPRSPRYRSRSRSYYRSRSRSRSRYHRRSHSRSRYHRRSRSRARSIGRRYYGFARRIYSPCYRRRSRTPSRSRSRSRSWSRSHLRLTEKDRKELLEIAKANAAKMLGKDDIELPESLKNDNSQKSTEVTVKTYTEKR